MCVWAEGGALFPLTRGPADQYSLKLLFLSTNQPRKPHLSKETKPRPFSISLLGIDPPQFKLSLSLSVNADS